MEEQNKVIEQVVEELKSSDESELQKVIEQWFERTRTQGLKIGAQMISAAVAGIIQKHIKNGTKPSLRSYERCIKEIVEIISIQLTKQNDLVKEDATNGQESSI